jgi:hypothetical protein
MVLVETPLEEEIVVKKVVVEGAWAGGGWTLQDVYSSIQARPADIFFWGSEISEAEVVGLVGPFPIPSIPGWTPGDVCLVWRSTSRTISNFAGRSARWIGDSFVPKILTGSPYLSCTVCEGHASLLANVLGYGVGDHLFQGVVYDLRVPGLVEALIPPLLLQAELPAVEEVMVAIGIFLNKLPDRGLAYPADVDGGALSPALQDEGRRIWNQALHSSDRWKEDGIDFSVRQCVKDEFQYLWWHREVHIWRGFLSLECITLSETLAMTVVTPGEFQYGAPGGEPGVAEVVSETVPCWFYNRGLCTRGSDCRYRHDPSLRIVSFLNQLADPWDIAVHMNF